MTTAPVRIDSEEAFATRERPAPDGRRAALALALFTATLFVNAALLFSVEPMFTKMVLPLLGGTPAVWNTCLLFFQAALLVGYLYAHLTTRWLDLRRQMTLHLALLALSLLALPVAVAPGWRPPGAETPIPWLLALLTVSLGAPFLVLSAGAPLLQRWFSQSDHPSAQNPYFLYAASNLGSLAALLAYPFLIEPHLPLAVQSRAWQVGYWALVALVAACAVTVGRARRRPAVHAGVPAAPAEMEAEVEAEGDPRPVTARQVVRWVLLSFAPSSLLLGVTSYLSIDVAAVPLLWVIPLSIYLLTFVLVFARRPPLQHWLMVWVQAVLVVPLAILLMFGTNRPLWLLASFHLLAFFATAMVCHGELAASRPPASRLTEFYLWISVGGVLGGVFNVLVAPTVFDTVLEYPLALLLAVALRSSGDQRPAGWRTRWRDLALPLVVGLIVWNVMRPDVLPDSWGPYAVFALVGVAAGICFLFRDRPVRFALGLAAILVGGALGRGPDHSLLRDRSFFGAYRVRQWGYGNVLMNGTTMHGAQDRRPQYRREPLTYYHREGPLGQMFASLVLDRPSRRVALVGLGTGTTACYGRAGERWTFYEIDPLIERIARNPRYFTYLRDCPPSTTVVLGDARLRLADAPARGYDLILLDAFSSDAIPTHLLTREALALYLSKLADGGAVAFHISNRYVNLLPVVAELARDARVAGVVGRDLRLTDEQQAMLKTTSQWVVVSRRAADLATLARQPGWHQLPPRGDVGVWTDDFSDILSVFTWR